MKPPLFIIFLISAFAGHAAALNGSGHKQYRVQQTGEPYDSMKQSVQQLLVRLRHSVNVDDTASLQKYFVGVVADSIIPYWYGTAWDFDGDTQEPRKGAIACGYFVVTVLRDAGLKINRVKWGQSSSEYISYALAEKKDIKIFDNRPLPEVIDYIKSRGTGLYIIGLDSHVGFILHDNKGIWFIHSKWFDEHAVVKEAAASSNVLYYSQYRMVAKISNSRKLLRAWVKEELIN